MDVRLKDEVKIYCKHYQSVRMAGGSGARPGRRRRQTRPAAGMFARQLSHAQHELDLFKRTRFLEAYLERSAGAERPLWCAASFDLIVNGTPSFFNVAQKKGIIGP